MPQAETYFEPGSQLPVMGKWDVVVAGGGPAGCAAALASARQGKKTLLVESAGFLGGATVSQLVCVILTTNASDLCPTWYEFARAMRKRGAMTGMFTAPIRYNGVFDPEQVKYVWDELISSAGIDLLHHCMVAGTIVDDQIVRGVIVETRAGRQAIFGRRIIDCTGDGVVSARAGVPWQQGDGVNKYAMALTKVCRLGGIHWSQDFPNEPAMEKLRQQLEAAVQNGEYSAPVVTEMNRLLGYIRDKAWQLPHYRHEIMSVISRVLKTDPLDPWAVTAAEREGRRQVAEAADFYRRYVPGCENAFLADTSNQIGIRSSRRIEGLATVTQQDAWNFAKYPDAVARSSWHIDIWPADSYSRPAVAHNEADYEERKKKLYNGDYFDIRYGCLAPKDVDNLLVAGRCISAEHAAQSSLRIQQTCMATGHAAGTAAALSLDADLCPRQLDTKPLIAMLDEQRAAAAAFEEFLANKS